jgi:hypothetical protein
VVEVRPEILPQAAGLYLALANANVVGFAAAFGLNLCLKIRQSE